MLNLSVFLEASARSHPDRDAVVLGGTRLIYAQLDTLANKVAGLLVSRGVRPGDKVALSCPNLPYFPITPLFPWFGPLGAVPLPSKWIIDFGPPVETSGYPEGAWRDPAVIAELTAAVSGSIQAKLDDLIVERGPAFG